MKYITTSRETKKKCLIEQWNRTECRFVSTVRKNFIKLGQKQVKQSCVVCFYTRFDFIPDLKIEMFAIRGIKLWHTSLVTWRKKQRKVLSENISFYEWDHVKIVVHKYFLFFIVLILIKPRKLFKKIPQGYIEVYRLQQETEPKSMFYLRNKLQEKKTTANSKLVTLFQII